MLQMLQMLHEDKCYRNPVFPSNVTSVTFVTRHAHSHVRER